MIDKDKKFRQNLHTRHRCDRKEHEQHHTFNRNELNIKQRIHRHCQNDESGNTACDDDAAERIKRLRDVEQDDEADNGQQERRSHRNISGDDTKGLSENNHRGDHEEVRQRGRHGSEHDPLDEMPLDAPIVGFHREEERRDTDVEHRHQRDLRRRQRVFDNTDDREDRK